MYTIEVRLGNIKVNKRPSADACFLMGKYLLVFAVILSVACDLRDLKILSEKLFWRFPEFPFK